MVLDAVLLQIHTVVSRDVPDLFNLIAGGLNRAPLPGSMTELLDLERDEMVVLLWLCCALWTVLLLASARPQMQTSYHLTRGLLLRGAALCYLSWFMAVSFEGRALFGSFGLVPCSPLKPSLDVPFFDWLEVSLASQACGLPDWVLEAIAWTGVLLSFIQMTSKYFNYSSGLLSILLWGLQLMIHGMKGKVSRHERLMFEIGFLNILLGPWVMSQHTAAATTPLIVFLFQWRAISLFDSSVAHIRISPHRHIWEELARVDQILAFVPLLLACPLRPARIGGAVAAITSRLCAVIASEAISGNAIWMHMVCTVPLAAFLDDDLLSNLYPRPLASAPPPQPAPQHPTSDGEGAFGPSGPSRAAGTGSYEQGRAVWGQPVPGVPKPGGSPSHLGERMSSSGTINAVPLVVPEPASTCLGSRRHRLCLPGHLDVFDMFHSSFSACDWEGVLRLEQQVLRVVGVLEERMLEVITELRDSYGALTLKIDFGFCDLVVAGVATPELALGLHVGGLEMKQESQAKIMTCVPGIYTRLAIAHEEVGNGTVASRMRQRAVESEQQLSSLQRRLTALSEQQRTRREGLEIAKGHEQDQDVADRGRGRPTDQPLSDGSLQGAWREGCAGQDQEGVVKVPRDDPSCRGLSAGGDEQGERGEGGRCAGEVGGSLELTGGLPVYKTSLLRVNRSIVRRGGRFLAWLMQAAAAICILGSSISQLKSTLSSSSQCAHLPTASWAPWRCPGGPAGPTWPEDEPFLDVSFTHAELQDWYVNEWEEAVVRWVPIEFVGLPGPRTRLPHAGHLAALSMSLLDLEIMEQAAAAATRVGPQRALPGARGYASAASRQRHVPPILNALSSKILAGDTLVAGLLASELLEILQEPPLVSRGVARLPTAVKAEWWVRGHSRQTATRLANSTRLLWSQQLSDGEGRGAAGAHRTVPQRAYLLLLSLAGVSVSLRNLLAALSPPGSRAGAGEAQVGAAARLRVSHIKMSSTLQSLAEILAFSLAAFSLAMCASYRRWHPLAPGGYLRQGPPASAFALLLPVFRSLSALLPGDGALEGMPQPADAGKMTGLADEVSDVVVYRAVLSLGIILCTVLASRVIVILAAKRLARGNTMQVEPVSDKLSMQVLLPLAIWCLVTYFARRAISLQSLVDTL